jgi:hypothetical protein
MTRNFSILAAAATVAILAFSVGEASAMNLGGRGGTPGGGSNNPGGSDSHNNSVQEYWLNGCNDRVDLTQFTAAARGDYLRRCGPERNGF